MAATPRWIALSDQEKAECTGEQRKSSLCSKHAWNVIGSLQSEWNTTIKPQIDLIIEKNFKLVFGREGVSAVLSLHLYLLSSTEDATTVRPTIFILTSDRKVASRARKLIQSHPLFKNLDTGFDIDYERKSIFMRVGDVDVQQHHRWTPEHIDRTTSTLCGAPVVVTPYPISQDPKWRTGTVLSVVHSGEQAFAILPAHLFFPEAALSPIDSDNQSDTCSHSSRSDQDDDQTSDDSGYSGSNFSSQSSSGVAANNTEIDLPLKHCVYLKEGTVTAEVDMSSLTLLGFFDPKIRGPVGVDVRTFSRALDYALVAIEDKTFDLPNQTSSSSGEIIRIDTCCTAVQDGKALILSASQGTQVVQLSGTATTMIFPWCTQPQSVWQVEYALSAGDSGSLVIYPDGQMVGMAFASVPELNITYVMPAADMFKSIRVALDCLGTAMITSSADTMIPTPTPLPAPSSSLPLPEVSTDVKADSAKGHFGLVRSDQTTEPGASAATKDGSLTTTPSSTLKGKMRDSAPVQLEPKRPLGRSDRRQTATTAVSASKVQKTSKSETASASGSASRGTKETSLIAAPSATSIELKAGEVRNGRLYNFNFAADHLNLVLFDIRRTGTTWENAELFYNAHDQAKLPDKLSSQDKNRRVRQQMATMGVHRRSIIEDLVRILSDWQPFWMENVKLVQQPNRASVIHFELILKRQESNPASSNTKSSETKLTTGKLPLELRPSRMRQDTFQLPLVSVFGDRSNISYAGSSQPAVVVTNAAPRASRMGEARFEERERERDEYSPRRRTVEYYDRRDDDIPEKRRQRSRSRSRDRTVLYTRRGLSPVASRKTVSFGRNYVPLSPPKTSEASTVASEGGETFDRERSSLRRGRRESLYQNEERRRERHANYVPLAPFTPPTSARSLMSLSDSDGEYSSRRRRRSRSTSTRGKSSLTSESDDYTKYIPLPPALSSPSKVSSPRNRTVSFKELSDIEKASPVEEELRQLQERSRLLDSELDRLKTRERESQLRLDRLNHQRRRDQEEQQEQLESLWEQRRALTAAQGRLEAAMEERVKRAERAERAEQADLARNFSTTRYYR